MIGTITSSNYYDAANMYAHINSSGFIQSSFGNSSNGLQTTILEHIGLFGEINQSVNEYKNQSLVNSGILTGENIMSPIVSYTSFGTSNSFYATSAPPVSIFNTLF